MSITPTTPTVTIRNRLARLRPLRPIMVLFGIIIAGICTRSYHISYLSLWNDEAFSRYYYKIGLHYMWTEGLHRESSPPLYYMAVGAWIDLFGSSEAALRSLSAASSSVAIALVYLLGKQLLSRTQALVASLLFAVSATQIYYAQEARPYALLLIPVALTLLACARYMRAPGRPLPLLCYVAAATTSIYTHATMVLFVTASGIAVLIGAWCIDHHSRGRTARRWIVANFAVMLLALPALIGMRDHVGSGILSWIAPVGFREIGAVVSNTVVGTLTPSHFPGAALAGVLICVLAVALWRNRPSGHMATIVLAPAGLYAALVILVSLFFQPILLSRIFCWVGIPLSLLEAYALTARGWLRPIAITAMVGVIGVSLFYQFDASADAKEPWRNVIHSASLELRQADLVVLGPDTDPAALIYYAPPLEHVAMWTHEQVSAADLGIMPRLFGVSGILPGEITRQIDSGARVVIVARATDEAVLSHLLEHVAPATRRIDRRCIGADGKPTHYPCGITVLAWATAAGLTAGDVVTGAAPSRRSAEPVTSPIVDPEVPAKSTEFGSWPEGRP